MRGVVLLVVIVPAAAAADWPEANPGRPSSDRFDVRLSIAQLAFPAGPYLDTAKLAVLIGSGAAIAAGLLTGLVTRRRRT